MKSIFMWLLYSTKLIKKQEPYAPDFIEYGYGYRGRKLLDGRYVLEKEGEDEALDLVSHRCHKWPAHSEFYTDCMAPNAKALNKIAKKALARRGI